jgi:hypothetical protein
MSATTSPRLRPWTLHDTTTRLATFSWLSVFGPVVSSTSATWSSDTFFPDGVSRMVCPIAFGSERDFSSYQTTSEKYFSPSSTVDTVRPL